MKKFLAMLLAAMMLLSSVGAMADVQNDSELKIGTPTSQFKDGNKKTDYSVTEGEVDTELWLQVAADGQIDVTVPLVLIFSTNVDGGEATEATNYKITNNNDRSSISVDKIAVTTNPKNTHMTLNSSDKNINRWDSTTRDQYYVTLTPSTEYTGEDATTSFDVVYDLYNATAKENKYDETGDTKDNTSVFRIGENSSVKLTANMVTTPLTFVTGNNYGNYLDKREGEAYTANTRGVELLTITYTVALEYDTVQDALITSSDETITAGTLRSTHAHYDYE